MCHSRIDAENGQPKYLHTVKKWPNTYMKIGEKSLKIKWPICKNIYPNHLVEIHVLALLEWISNFSEMKSVVVVIVVIVVRRQKL